MTIVERTQRVFEDEKRTKQAEVKSWEISGTDLPKQKSFPVRLSLSGCRPILMSVSHIGADFFIGVPVSPREFLKMKWRQLWKR